MELITHKPDGGPQILVLHDPAALTASFGWFVNTGARDEPAEIMGVSHFLEHMVFKGTARRTADQINREFDDLGARSNAFTSEDRTVFYASVLPEFQTQTVDLLSDLMQPALDPNEFEQERLVILEEIAMYEDQPPYGAFERAGELLFGPHPLSYRILGSVESVSDLRVDQLREYHRTRYTKDNMVFAAAGNVQVEPLLEQVESLSRDFPDHASGIDAEPPRLRKGSDTIEKDLSHQYYAVMVWPGLDWHDPQRYALHLLCSVLADQASSRIYWELIENGKAETATLSPQSYRDVGCLIGFLCCRPEEAEEVEQVFEKVVCGIRGKPVTERELELARNRICSSLVMRDEFPQNRLFDLGNSWLNRREYLSLDVQLRRYESVEVEDLAQLADRLLGEPLVRVRVLGDR